MLQQQAVLRLKPDDYAGQRDQIRLARLAQVWVTFSDRLQIIRQTPLPKLQEARG